MDKNARRRHGGYKLDRAGRIVDGLVDNGRLILMISLCLSIGFMLKQISGLAPTVIETTSIATPPLLEQESPQPDNRIQERSDYRVELFTLCADKSFEELNTTKCEKLLHDVDGILDEHNKNTIREKSSPSDGGTHLDTESQPLVVASRTI